MAGENTATPGQGEERIPVEVEASGDVLVIADALAQLASGIVTLAKSIDRHADLTEELLKGDVAEAPHSPKEL